ncbi:MAG: FG-GAP-like repeat-containing protein, partial [Planctomycetota bacterium]
RAASVPVGSLRFEEVAESCGLILEHRSGARGEFSYPEIVSAGICVADLDGDQDLDVYVPQGGPVPGDDGARPSNRLFLNDGKGNFQDATTGSGADNTAYGMGAYAADIDTDGDLDLLLTNVGELVLLRNNGNAKFEDVTEAAGLGGRSGFWLNAAFADFNSDGILDLYVANYTKWIPGEDPDCTSPGGGADYCNPSRYEGLRDLLVFGRGDGTFEDKTESSGIGTKATRSMGVIALDTDQDGDQDIYVANDGEANLLWINDGNGVFKEEALIRGAALNGAGAAEASMGVACVDIDQDGDEDFIMSHLERETHTFYRNDDGFFTDVTAQIGLAGWSRPDTGFGIGFADLNLDGQWDLFAANGGVIHPTAPRNPARPYAQADRVALGVNGRFPVALELDRDREDQDAQASTTARVSLVSRGSAFGDLDGDGRIDILVAAKDGPLRYWRNTTTVPANWIGIRPVPKKGAATEIAAAVYLVGTPSWATVRPQGSYLGNHEAIIRFGNVQTGQSATIDVVWNDKSRERFAGLGLTSVHEVVKGRGEKVDASMLATETTNSHTSNKVVDQSLTGGSNNADSIQYELPKGPIVDLPPIDSTQLPDGTIKVTFDEAALADWCAKARLPKPPEIGGLDGPTWRLVHSAMKSISEKPTIERLGNLAMLYDGNRALEPASRIYANLVQLAPGQSKWWHLLGRTQFELGRPEEAVNSFEKAVQLAPDVVAGIGRLAESQFAAGDSGESLNNWQRYIKLNPSDPSGHIGLARAAEVESDLPLARKSAERALELNKRARSALVVAARVTGKQGDTNVASSYSAAAARLTKNDDPVMVDDIDLEMRKYSRSVSYLRQAANFYKNNGNLPEARKAAILLAERRPADAQNWKMLTWLSLSMKKLDEAG